MTQGRKTGGRQKGVVNHTTAAVKEAILQAFHNLGGVEYLETIGENDPKVFAMLLAKVLPAEVKSEITGPGGGPIVVATGVPAPPEPAP